MTNKSIHFGWLEGCVIVRDRKACWNVILWNEGSSVSENRLDARVSRRWRDTNSATNWEVFYRFELDGRQISLWCFWDINYRLREWLGILIGDAVLSWIWVVIIGLFRVVIDFGGRRWRYARSRQRCFRVKALAMAWQLSRFAECRWRSGGCFNVRVCLWKHPRIGLC